MKKLFRAVRITLVAALSPCVASAQGPGGGTLPLPVQKLVNCRSVTDDQARLACYDAGMSQFDAAAKRGDVAVIDRDDVRRTRRSLFGFALPDVGNLFAHRGGADHEDRDEVKELTARIRSVGRNGDGGYVVTLDDGAQWEQTDSVALGRSPRPGETVTIRRAALGSFKMTFAMGPGVRARRIR